MILDDLCRVYARRLRLQNSMPSGFGFHIFRYSWNQPSSTAGIGSVFSLAVFFTVWTLPRHAPCLMFRVWVSKSTSSTRRPRISPARSPRSAAHARITERRFLAPRRLVRLYPLRWPACSSPSQIPSHFFLHPIGYFENCRAILHAMMPTITHSRELVSTSKPVNIHRVHKDGAIPP